MVFLNPKSPSAVLFLTDAYKLDHRRQYPEGTEYVYANFTNRGSRIEGVNHVVHFGLQAFIRGILMDGFDTFFKADEDEVAADYERKMEALLGPNEIGTDHIRALHQLGYLPLRFCAVPEGTPVPLRVPSFTVENTQADFFWVTNYIETVLSSEVWQPSTSATTAWRLRRLLDAAAEKTSSIPEFVAFQGHDFSFRGLSSSATAAGSGAGHLLSFTGTDSLVSIDHIDYFYGGDNGFIGGSIPATEHSVMCALIEKYRREDPDGDRELAENKAFMHLLDLYKSGMFSVVSDTFDFWRVLTSILPSIKDRILNRDGKVVIRPDSGDPVEIICGTVPATDLLPNGTPQQKGAIEVLWDTFGGTVNSKGFKELDPHIGLIYGDSITFERAEEIVRRLESKGFASTNVVFGVGSFTYQYVTRDTFGSAIKATWAQINGETYNLQKQPATDNGLKKSATGRLAVLSGYDGNLYLAEQATPEQEAQSVLQPIWENGEFVNEQTFADARQTLLRWTNILTRNGTI